MDYFTVEYNVSTGETIRREWSGEQIAEFEALKAKAEVPASITPRQCRLLLLQQGILSQVENMIASSTDDVKIAWEYALEFRRNDPILNAFAANLVPPLTEEQINQFFIKAAKL